MLGLMLENLKTKGALVHNITNYVTVNDCANILIACGASPIMSDDIDEVEEIVSICKGLNINIGTLNKRTIKSMLKAGRKANELNKPICLDPVGVGASNLRTQTAQTIISELSLSLIRGNISEIKTLALGYGTTCGVDASEFDLVTKDNLTSVIKFAKEFSKSTGAVIVISGAIDIVANDKQAYCIYNGDPMMSKITGTGCQLSAMTSAFICANPQNVFESAVASVCAMGLCGEIARKRMNHLDGNSSYRNYIIDAIYNLDADQLESGAKYEVF